MKIKLFIRFVLPAIFLITGCTESSIAKNAITGKLKLYLHKREAADLYVRFDLIKDASNSQGGTSQDGTFQAGMSQTSMLQTSKLQSVSIASSGFKKVSESPIDFSLAYLPEKINQQEKYTFIVTLSEDSQGEKEVSSMSVPVLTQGHPSNLNLALQPLVAPLE